MPSVLLLVAVAATGIAAATGSPAHTTGRQFRSRATDVALGASVVGILSLTLLPQDASEEDLQLVPFSHIVEALTPPLDLLLVDIVLNVLLFLPFGAALFLRGLSIGKTALAAAALSATVELTQLLVVTGRTTSVDDVLLNTIGALLGHVTLSKWTAAREVSPSVP